MRWPVVEAVEGENWWVTYAKQVVTTKNNSLNLINTGVPGSGKSWSTLSYFCLIDPDFELDNNWFFYARDFMNEAKKKFKKGKILGYDEGGVDLHNLKYYDAVNRGLNAFLQTGRSKNYIFGLTVPYISLISKGVRCLLNAQWKAVGWNKQKKTTTIIPRDLEFNDELNKFYKKRLIVRTNGEVGFCDTIKLPMPPKRIIIDYEKQKREFQEKLYDKLGKDIERADSASVTRIKYKQTCLRCNFIWDSYKETLARCSKCQSNKVFNEKQLKSLENKENNLKLPKMVTIPTQQQP